MKFSQEDIKLLKKCGEKKIVLVVSGKNTLGQPFSAEGYILPYMIGDNVFGLYIGQSSRYDAGEFIDLFVPLYCHLDNHQYMDYNIIVDKIVAKQRGKVIYKNPDFETIIERSLIVHDDELGALNNSSVKEFASLIGKPIKISCTKQVIKAAYMYYGCLYVSTTEGYVGHDTLQVKPEDVKLDDELYENPEFKNPALNNEETINR